MQQIQFKQDSSAWLVATPEHPFWTEEDGWRMTRYLKPGHTLQLAGGGSATVIDHTPLRPTSLTNVVSAWHDDGSVSWLQHDHKQHWQTYQPDADNLPEVDHHSVWQARVYNFAVEGFLTYYVGEAGVWVHNECPVPKEQAMDTAVKMYRDMERREQKAQEMVNKCFPPDTLVWCEDDKYPIQSITVGMKVLSRCEHTGEVAYKRVSKVYQHDGAIIDYVRFQSKNEIGDGLVMATASHPFWVDGRGWVAVADLKLGDCLVAQNGERMPITYLEHSYDDDYLVYNLEVEDFHTYFVEWEGVWVHNKNKTTVTPLNEIGKVFEAPAQGKFADLAMRYKSHETIIDPVTAQKSVKVEYYETVQEKLDVLKKAYEAETNQGKKDNLRGEIWEIEGSQGLTQRGLQHVGTIERSEIVRLNNNQR